MNGTIRLQWSSWTPAEGDSIQLFQNVLTFAGTPVMESTVVDAEKGLYWDTSNLASKGFLRVTATPNGIGEINAQLSNVYVVEGKVYVPGANDIRIYTLDGVYINPDSRLSKGVYIVNADGRRTKISVE